MYSRKQSKRTSLHQTCIPRTEKKGHQPCKVFRLQQGLMGPGTPIKPHEYNAKVPVPGRTEVIHQRPFPVDCVFLSPSIANYRMLITWPPFSFPGASSLDSTWWAAHAAAPVVTPCLGARPLFRALRLPDKRNPPGVRDPPHQSWYFCSTLVIFPILFLAAWGRKESCIIFLLSRKITLCSAYALDLYC